MNQLTNARLPGETFADYKQRRKDVARAPLRLPYESHAAYRARRYAA